MVVGDCVTTIEDPEVAEEVWEELELEHGSLITSPMLASMNSLRLTSASVASLAGLECALGLEMFTLQSDGSGGNSPHTVEDLSPISGLPALYSVTLSYPGFHDISALSEIASLRDLDLAQTEVTDLTPLTGLPELSTLNIAGTPITDLGPLPEFPSLRRLYARDAAISDVSQLVGCASLYEVGLDGTAVSEVSVLATMPELSQLDVSRTAVADLSAFSDGNLHMLFASETQIDTIPEDLPISNGRFAGNGIVDLAPLLTWEHVASVDLSNNAIEDVSPLLLLPWEETADYWCVHIDLSGNPLTQPDAEATFQQLCDSWYVVFSADGLGCSHEACLPGGS